MKRFSPALLFISGIALTVLVAPIDAIGAAAGDTVADRVLGQRRLSTSIPYFVDGRVFSATDLAIDRSVSPNRIYLADAGLNRVLGWSDIRRFRARESADLVLGQPSLFLGAYVLSAQNCPAPPSATNFCWPNRVAVDHRGNLYVVDVYNSRVLEFDSPFTTDRVADRVFGPPDFTSRGNSPRNPGWYASNYNEGLSVDGAGNVWMVDPSGTRRVLEFDDPLTHDTRPDRVIEPGTEQQCFSNPRPQNRLCDPNDLEVSPQGDLYVQDFGPAGLGGPHLMILHQPLATDLTPDVVLDGYGYTGLLFDPSGNLYTAGGFYISRVPAPIGPGSVGQVVAGPFRNEIYTGRPDRDSEGNIYSTGTPWPENPNDRVYVFDAPFQGEPVRIGRGPVPDRDLQRPSLVAVDRSSSPNHLYVADAHNRILGWRDAAGFANGDPADLVLSGDDPHRPGTCNFVDAAVNASRFCLDGSMGGGLAVDSRGNLWLSDVLGHRVLKFDRPFDTDAVADRVLGQGGSFTSRACNKGGRSARSLCFPGALAFDSRDNLYVADQYNHRVLLFLDPAKDSVADKVFGQPGFSQGACNRGNFLQARADTLCFGYEDGSVNVSFYAASGLAVDPQGNLFVADSNNARVLVFQDAARSDTLPDAVLGQDSFRTRQQGTGPRRFGGRGAGDYPTLFGPSGLALSPAGELYVADTPNDRLLVFANPLSDTTADRVFGHSDFTTGGTSPLFGKVPPASASRLLRPLGLAFDALGNLYVADAEYNRVLAFDRP